MIFKKYYLPCLAIIFLTVLVWHKLINQTPLGEGFYYFDPGQRYFDFWQGDNFARVIFGFLPQYFGDNLSLYMAFQLLVMVLVHLSFFTLILYITKNILVSFTTTTLFLGSFIGSFEMLGSGNYQRFIQRVPNLIPFFFSFLLFIKYLESKKLSHYFLSILLFAISLWMGHFSTFLVAIFLIYSFFYSKSKILLSIPFFIVNYLMIKTDHLTPTTNIGSFLAHHKLLDLFREITLQLSNMLLPIPLIHKIAAISSPYTDTLIVLTIPFVLLLLIGIKIVHKKNPKYLNLYLTSLAIIPILLFLNLYLGKVDADYNIAGSMPYYAPSDYPNRGSLEFIKGDRYYYLPTFFLSILFTLILYSIFSKQKKVLYPILFIYLIYNTNLIWQSMDKIQPLSDATKNYLSFIKKRSDQINNQSTILSPQDILWSAPLIKTYYHLPELTFILKKPGFEKELPQDKTNLFIFRYDYQNKEVIDESGH